MGQRFRAACALAIAGSIVGLVILLRNSKAAQKAAARRGLVPSPMHVCVLYI